MRNLNIAFLIEATNVEIVKRIDFFFNRILKEIEVYLNFDPINKSVIVEYIDEELKGEKLWENIFSIGVKRFYKNGVLYVNIYKNYLRYIPIILLREAYYNFIPHFDSQMNAIDIFINQIVIIDLEKLDSIKNWNELIRNKLINYEFISKEYNRLENFLKRGERPVRFFFNFIRKNVQIIKEKQDNLYDILFQQNQFQSSYFYTDDMLETIRVLAKIFYRVQYYTALLDYQNYFKKFKSNGFIQTHLSVNKFTENMQIIKKFSMISPSYKVNWPALGILSINCFIKFNPILNKKKIQQFLERLPFFIAVKECRNSFGSEIDGYFVIPKEYFTDLKNFLNNLENFGYTIKIKWMILNKNGFFVNLNYLRTEYSKKKILHNNITTYDNKYELWFSMDYGKGAYSETLSLIDWLIIDRIRYVSLTGFNFERLSGTIKSLKDDLLNEVISQRKFIQNLKENLLNIHASQDLKDSFIDFLNKNESFGFFLINDMLYKYTMVFKLIVELLIINKQIKSEHDFVKYINKFGISSSIENNVIFRDLTMKKVVLNEFIPLYFKSKTKFEREVEKYEIYYKIFNSCFDLKIFNLKTIRVITQNKSLINTIFTSKEQKLKNSYESFEISEINYQLVEEKLEKYLNHDPPIIKPNLIANILIPKTQIYILLLKHNSETSDNLGKISFITKRMGYGSNGILYVVIFIPILNREEKRIFSSIITNIFKGNLISFKRFLWSGLIKAFTRKDFYDLEQKKFFYTKDLFKEFFLNVRSILGEVQKPLPEIQSMQHKRFWSEELDISHLVKEVEDRVRNETVDLSIENLRKLFEFYTLLSKNLLNIEEFKKSQEKFFFKNYINSIDFIPTFQNFGISQYFLYFYPTDIEKINFKLLMNNAFQSVNYPAQIDNSNSFLIQYIYPYRNPGISPYINWLTKSKKTIREYCLFFIKKFYQILHFDYNLDSEGWDLDPNRFKIYFQNVLFNPDYKAHIPDLKEFDIGDVNSSNYFGPNSSEFKALSQIYSWKSLDIKSYLTRRYFKINASITDLLKKGLIQPFLSLKNLDIVEEITIILPDVKKEHTASILKIFSFFNVGFIYETEGEYFIHGFEEVVKFENGIMIKLYFPDCEIDEFEKLFDLLFEYMEIDHYLILNDLVDGENLLKSTFNGLKFLETYNPLTNLIWNDKDKRWRNHKLFNENFEPVYPDMLFGKKNYDLDL